MNRAATASGYPLSGPLPIPTLYPCPTTVILNRGSMPKRSLSMGLGTQLYFVHLCPSFSNCPCIPPPCRASSPTVGGGGEMRKCHSKGRVGVGQGGLGVRSCGASCPIWPGPLAWVWITGVWRRWWWRRGAGIWAGAGSTEAGHCYLLCRWRLCFFTCCRTKLKFKDYFSLISIF